MDRREVLKVILTLPFITQLPAPISKEQIVIKNIEFYMTPEMWGDIDKNILSYGRDVVLKGTP